MTHRELVRQIARRTGESIKTIRSRGFSRWRANAQSKDRTLRSVSAKE